jgi:zinc protease
MLKALGRLLVLAGMLALCRTSGADASAPSPLPAPPAVPFTKFQLANGLEVIFHEDRSLPLVAVNLWYHVGPANEPPGRSGFAHLFEHLMFEGSRHVGREFDRLLEASGATNSNGTTSWDRTNYFETVPREHLELVLWLESDRMGFMLDMLTPERLEIQRGVVKNERRQTYENAPYGPSTLALYDALFPPGHPYHGAVIGSMQDLSAASLEDVKQFFRAYYAPSNATLALAGDFDPPTARALIERYFGTLPDRPKPPPVTRATLPPPQPREIVVPEPVQLAKVTMGWLTPVAYSPEDATLDVTMAVLAGGKATRLYRSLIVEQKLAADVSAELDSNQITSIAEISATAASGKSEAALKQALHAVIGELAKAGPSVAELDRAKRRILLSVQSQLLLLNGPGGESGRAGLLQRFNHYTKDPGYLTRWVSAIEKVTAADVQRSVDRYLKPDRAVVVITKPEPAKQ